MIEYKNKVYSKIVDLLFENSMDELKKMIDFYITI